MMLCPHCDNRLVHKSDSGARIRIHGAIEVDQFGQAHAQCFWCKSEVSLPLKFVTPDDSALRKVPKYVIKS